MNVATLKVMKLRPDARLPRYAHPDDAGLDLCAVEAAEIPPGATQLVLTGIALQLPLDTEAQVRSRSGLALKHGVAVLNSPGTIDANYRGEIGVILINHGREPFRIEPGARIAQLVVAPIARVQVVPVEHLDSSDRGSAGFGSTGI
ncbi:deoxyuridine 5'-triphosphate nucleotidohydrolase (dut) [Rubidibacter lacunae KORDI 51-2]|uniref:Deoxyuridine 5'-triphosphate nucleotidohydrolase n=1 Tax=Rubidibacter lacunae KORDI 51-2 TaxID=582515 RepID=U5DPZ3_9CHRO|nr:dUTP diphosphatase [Rubidibacter lacunae]ERN41770.1 deoxyuridine 5'-triphosphate nucleotidohydrolase (dut) [Rubidibacter lacunae KORDI 51-2]